MNLPKWSFKIDLKSISGYPIIFLIEKSTHLTQNQVSKHHTHYKIKQTTKDASIQTYVCPKDSLKSQFTLLSSPLKTKMHYNPSNNDAKSKSIDELILF